MSMPERPDWWPPWDGMQAPLEVLPDAWHWQRGAQAGVKAVIERIEALAGHPALILEEDWRQLREEAGLE